jgi:hypothetical protein
VFVKVITVMYIHVLGGRVFVKVITDMYIHVLEVVCL